MVHCRRLFCSHQWQLGAMSWRTLWSPLLQTSWWPVQSQVEHSAGESVGQGLPSPPIKHLCPASPFDLSRCRRTRLYREKTVVDWGELPHM
jgi:hypothetical protein